MGVMIPNKVARFYGPCHGVHYHFIVVSTCLFCTLRIKLLCFSSFHWLQWASCVCSLANWVTSSWCHKWSTSRISGWVDHSALVAGRQVSGAVSDVVWCCVIQWLWPTRPDVTSWHDILSAQRPSWTIDWFTSDQLWTKLDVWGSEFCCCLCSLSLVMSWNTCNVCRVCVKSRHRFEWDGLDWAEFYVPANTV